MSAVVAEQELFRACQIIFGDELNISRDFLTYVQMSGVKSAYRKRAKETHPDCFAGQGELAQRFGARKFQVVQKAYKNLTHFVDAREKGYHIPRPVVRTQPMAQQRATAKKNPPKPASAQTHFRQKAKPSAPPKSSQWSQQNAESYVRKTSSFDSKALFKGQLPERPMLFGHFLYYSGLVDWQTIIRALIWQRSSRPRVGDIGVRFGWLAQQDILAILQSGHCRDAFGVKAIAEGKLTQHQVNTMLSFQKKYHRRIGEYFLEKRVLTQVQLQDLLQKCQHHNSRYEKIRRKAS